MKMRYANRREAGRYLARELGRYAKRNDVVVQALPRGGVPVGYEVARALHAPLDIVLVRKLGVPGHEEFAMGAMASGGVIFLNHYVIEQMRIPDEEIDRAIARERRELDRREEAYKTQHRLEVAGQTVILVDDGLATGSTMRVAVEAMRHHEAASVVVAVPVASRSTCEDMKAIADEVVCVMQPEFFSAVGEWYEDFSQTTDSEVQELLQAAAGVFMPLSAR